MKYLSIFLVLVLVIGMNMPENMLARYGVESNYLSIILAAAVLTGAMSLHKIFLVIIMLLLAVGANLPDSVAMQYSLDRDILLATLIALIIIPVVQRQLED